jgi:hypothetical protein
MHLIKGVCGELVDSFPFLSSFILLGFEQPTAPALGYQRNLGVRQ